MEERELQDPSEESLSLVFSRLKPYCIDLLDLLRNPKRDSSFLPKMADFLRLAPAAALQPSLDYTLLPFLLLLDAAVQCRKEMKGDSNGGSLNSNAPLDVLEVRDSAAEGMLLCLEELLKKCYLTSVNQMVEVLEKLAYGALLSPSEASEEFREGIIRCFRAMLLPLQPCSDSSCPCKQRIVLPTTESISPTFSHLNTLSRFHAEPQECLLAFLQSQNASAAVGHWLSLLLQVAELEILRGHLGSANLRKEAFITLRVLVSKVGAADALAFFLPGVVSRLSKALYVSKNVVSGAAGSAGALEHALRGLDEFLITVLDDKTNLHALEMDMNGTTGSEKENESTQSVLEVLRSLPFNSSIQSATMSGGFANEPIDIFTPSNGCGGIIDHGYEKRTLFIHRSKEWIRDTSSNVDKFISAAFPRLCVHPAEKVRKALVDGISGLLSHCKCTLQRSKLMLLECLCVLACDDAENVSTAAQNSMESLFGLGEKFIKKEETSEIFMRLMERLPLVVLGNDETVALVHAQKLLSLIYFAGPDLLVDHLLHSPVNASRILECLELCFSHNSCFAGSMSKLITSKPLSAGYLLSIAELKAGSTLSSLTGPINAAILPVLPKVSNFQNRDLLNLPEIVREFPHMPPWFGNVGSHKLYLTLAAILRLAGLSIISGHKSGMFLSVLLDELLDHFCQLISELRMKEYDREGWRVWYYRHGSGQLLRKTSGAVCMLTEIIYGLSEQSVNTYSNLFQKTKVEIIQVNKLAAEVDDRHRGFKCQGSTWKIRVEKDIWNHVILSVGRILHEYLSSEVWDIPVDQNALLLEDEGDLPLHFFRDTIMLHQVILDGMGVFSLVLGKDFVHSGFLHPSLYLLLRNLICSSSEIRIASDAVLRVLAISFGHATVGEFVVANADYIIDSLCRELRHLDTNPHVPNVLAAILSYIGTARDILPLLEEPMRAVSSELDILGRHQNPKITIPFLKALGEIAKASKSEASLLPNQAESFETDVSAKVLRIQKWFKENNTDDISSCTRPPSPDKGLINSNDTTLHLEYWEQLMFKLNEIKRYRRIVGSLIGSCLKAAIPLVSSRNESACLVALDIIEDVSISLAKVEEAYKHEKRTKAAIQKAIVMLSLNDLSDEIEAEDEDVDENRVLPAMNKIWPYLIVCLKNKVSVAVIRRCLTVLHEAVQIGGGDFFVRRFHSDGHIIWKLLTSFPFQRKQKTSEENKILLPYRDHSLTLEDPMAEISNLKIQAAVLDMITMMCSNKRSSSALQTAMKKLSGTVVGIACSRMTGLRDSSLKTLSALASIDSDLIWLLLADVYYSLNKNGAGIAPPKGDFAAISDLLPPPSSSKEYLFANYAGENFSVDVDPSAVELVFRKMEAEASL